MRDLREFTSLGVYYAEYQLQRDGKSFSKKHFLITSAQRIKALFLKEEASENFSV